MKLFKFTARQMREWAHVDGIEDPYECMAIHANKILNEWLDKQPLVYSHVIDDECLPEGTLDAWSDTKYDFDDHSARLVDIKEIKKEGE